MLGLVEVSCFGLRSFCESWIFCSIEYYMRFLKASCVMDTHYAHNIQRREFYGSIVTSPLLSCVLSALFFPHRKVYSRVSALAAV